MKNDFDNAAAEIHRGLKREIEKRPAGPHDPAQNSIDRSVKEQVISDLDGLIDKYTGKR
jgi:hypothetical protein